MQAPGKTAINMDTGSRHGWMALSLRETTKKGRDMDTGNSYGKMGRSIMESFEKMNITERGFKSGAMGGSTTETECTTEWRGKGLFNGRTVEST